jgi:hypothetical protein
MMVDGLNAIDGIECEAAEGAMHGAPCTMDSATNPRLLPGNQPEVRTMLFSPHHPTTPKQPRQPARIMDDVFTPHHPTPLATRATDEACTLVSLFRWKTVCLEAWWRSQFAWGHGGGASLPGGMEEEHAAITHLSGCYSLNFK